MPLTFRPLRHYLLCHYICTVCANEIDVAAVGAAASTLAAAIRRVIASSAMDPRTLHTVKVFHSPAQRYPKQEHLEQKQAGIDIQLKGESGVSSDKDSDSTPLKALVAHALKTALGSNTTNSNNEGLISIPILMVAVEFLSANGIANDRLHPSPISTKENRIGLDGADAEYIIAVIEFLFIDFSQIRTEMWIRGAA